MAASTNSLRNSAAVIEPAKGGQCVHASAFSCASQVYNWPKGADAAPVGDTARGLRNAGWAAMVVIALFGAMQEEERRLLAERLDTARTDAGLTVLALAVGLALNAALILAVILLIRRDWAARSIGA